MFEGFLAVTQMVRRKSKNRWHFALGCFFSSFQKKYPLDVIFFFPLAFGRPPPGPPCRGCPKNNLPQKITVNGYCYWILRKKWGSKKCGYFFDLRRTIWVKIQRSFTHFGGWLLLFDRFLISVTRNFKTRHYPISSSFTLMDKKKKHKTV